MKESHPFKENLVKSYIDEGVAGRNLFEFVKNKTKIIRQFPLDKFSKIFDNKFGEEEAMLKAKYLFDEVREKYDIDSPVTYVIGKGEDGSNVIFIITERIEPMILEKTGDFSKNREDAIPKFEKLFNSLIKYVEDKYVSKEWMMWDIPKESQYVYGKKPGESEQKIYLVDTDLQYAGLSEEFVFTYLYQLARFIESYESRLKIEFKKEKDRIIKFMEKICPEDKRLKDFEIERINEMFLVSSTKNVQLP